MFFFFCRVWMSNTMGFVSSQWKHTLWDGKSLAGYFSCCGQRLPWQVSLNHTLVCTCSFLLSLHLLLMNFSFSRRYGLKPNDQILAEDKHKALWVETTYLSKGLKLCGTKYGHAGQSQPPLLSGHLSWSQNSQVINDLSWEPKAYARL